MRAGSKELEIGQQSHPANPEVCTSAPLKVADAQRWQSRKMKRILRTIALPALGALIVLSSFFYDVIFAGIPYQDPTPELQAKYDFHKSVAEIGIKTGGVLFLIGIFAIPFIWFLSAKPNANKNIERTS